jgi:hypothetical protein
MYIYSYAFGPSDPHAQIYNLPVSGDGASRQPLGRVNLRAGYYPDQESSGYQLRESHV